MIVIDSQLYKYIRQTVTFTLHRNYLDAAIDQERKSQLKNELNYTMQMKHSQIQIEKHHQHDLLAR